MESPHPTSRSPRAARSGLLRRGVRIVAGLLLAWIGVGNLLLNLDVGRDLVNRDPGRFELRWQRAVTPLPGVVWATHVEANISTPRTLSWIGADHVIAVFEPWTLPQRILQTRSLRLRGVEVRTRPRAGVPPDEGLAQNAMHSHLPPIPNRAQDSTTLTEPTNPTRERLVGEDRPSWLIRLNGITSDGLRDARLHAVRLRHSGRLSGDIHYRTRDTLSVPEISASGQVEALRLSGQAVAETLAFDSALSIAPYIPREFRGHRMLRFVSGTLDVEGNVHSLHALNFYFGAESEVNVDGHGQISARIQLADGAIDAGSRARLDDTEVGVDWRQYHIGSRGTIDAQVEATDDGTRLTLGGADVVLHRIGDSAPLVTGGQIEVEHEGPRLMLAERSGDERVTLSVNNALIPDLATLNRYIPDELGVVLEAGDADVNMRWQIMGDMMDGELVLVATDAPSVIKGQAVRGDAEAQLRIRIDRSAGTIDASDSRVTITNGGTRNGDGPRQWSALLELESGRMERWTDPEGERRLRFGTSRIVLTGNVSDVVFLDILTGGRHDLGWSGAASISADVQLQDGRILSDSTLQLASDQLEVRFLDFYTTGRGEINAWIHGDGDAVDLSVAGALDNVNLRHGNDAPSHLSADQLHVTATGHAERLSGGLEDIEVSISMPSARVPDIRTYNRYLPPEAGIHFDAGAGLLSLQMLLAETNSNGHLTLAAPGIRATINGAIVTGNLNAEIRLSDGRPQQRLFDLAGSRIVLTGVNIDSNESQPVQDNDWWAEMNVQHGRVRWSTPLIVTALVETRARDSDPIVRLFLDERLRFDWMRRALETADVVGRTELGIHETHIVLSNLAMRSEDFEVEAQLQFGRQEPPRGMMLLSHGRLAIAVEMRDGERDWSLTRVRERYGSYPPFALPDLH